MKDNAEDWHNDHIFGNVNDLIDDLYKNQTKLLSFVKQDLEKYT